MGDFFYHTLQVIVAAALFIAVVLSLSGCASSLSLGAQEQERDAESWADTSHALGCVMGGLC